jgi:hypothetical protein
MAKVAYASAAGGALVAVAFHVRTGFESGTPRLTTGHCVYLESVVLCKGVQWKRSCLEG